MYVWAGVLGFRRCRVVSPTRRVRLDHCRNDWLLPDLGAFVEASRATNPFDNFHARLRLGDQISNPTFFASADSEQQQAWLSWCFWALLHAASASVQSFMSPQLVVPLLTMLSGMRMS